jgi:hypothetical protein
MGRLDHIFSKAAQAAFVVFGRERPRSRFFEDKQNPGFYQKKAILPPNLTKIPCFYPKNCHLWT